MKESDNRSGQSRFETEYTKFRERLKAGKYGQEYIYKCRWQNGYKCPNCMHDEHYEPYVHGKSGIMLYQCKECDHQTSVTSRTIFDKTRIPLPTLLHIIYLVARKGKRFSTVKIMEEVGCKHYKTVWAARKKIEEKLKRFRMLEAACKARLSGKIWRLLINRLFRRVKKTSKMSNRNKKRLKEITRNWKNRLVE